MQTTLISFLGNSGKTGEYVRTRYYYKNELQEPVAYIGYLLQSILKPNRFVVLGTTGSRWDHLFESDLNLKEELEEERIALIEAVEKEKVTQKQLNQLAPLLSNVLGLEVILKIVTPALTENEQIELLSLIDSVLDDKPGRLYLDVTHGYRTMPMVSFAAVQFLNAVKPKIKIGNIFYGQLGHETAEREKGIGHIHELTGFLNLNKWNTAFYHSEATGDYSLIAELIPDHKKLAKLISEASFYESIHLFKLAQNKFAAARDELEKTKLAGPAALFKPALLKRTEWVKKADSFSQQKKQAKRSLEMHDYLRAALYGYEAYITMRMLESSEYRYDINNGSRRSKFVEDLRGPESFMSDGEEKQFHFLRLLRNSLAHGEESPRKEIQAVVRNIDDLRTKLRKALNVLLD